MKPQRLRITAATIGEHPAFEIGYWNHLDSGELKHTSRNIRIDQRQLTRLIAGLQQFHAEINHLTAMALAQEENEKIGG